MSTLYWIQNPGLWSQPLKWGLGIFDLDLSNQSYWVGPVGRSGQSWIKRSYSWCYSSIRPDSTCESNKIRVASTRSNPTHWLYELADRVGNMKSPKWLTHGALTLATKLRECPHRICAIKYRTTAAVMATLLRSQPLLLGLCSALRSIACPSRQREVCLLCRLSCSRSLIGIPFSRSFFSDRLVVSGVSLYVEFSRSPFRFLL